jgi:Icc-related predicted phosphoesterase
MSSDKKTIRIAAVGDIHCRRSSQGNIRPLFVEVDDRADVLLLCGDLTDFGLVEEAQILAREVRDTVKVPVIAVLGNHDVESGHEEAVRDILSTHGIEVLDGDGIEIHGVGFAGVKGFGGGFGRRMLEPWGEATIKNYVREAVDESLKLESALARLRTEQRVAIMHYSPIQATVEGEPREIYPFLGSSRLEDPLNRHDVGAAFHAHVHRGSLEGQTRARVPVYNVALPLLRALLPHHPPFRVVTLPVHPEEEDEEMSIPSSAAPGLGSIPRSEAAETSPSSHLHPAHPPR